MAVRWVRCLAPFQALAPSDQLVLLRAAWKDLFLLHLAQWSAPWDLAPLLAAPAARARLPPDPLADLELNTLQVDNFPKFVANDKNTYFPIDTGPYTNYYQHILVQSRTLI